MKKPSTQLALEEYHRGYHEGYEAALKSVERRKTVRAKRPVQQPKHAITKREKCLHYNSTVDGSLCNDCHKKLR